MTADTPARVSDESDLRDAFYDQAYELTRSQFGLVPRIAAVLRHQDADLCATIAAQAERIAALEAEVAQRAVELSANEFMLKDARLRASVAESSLAETRAKVEGLEKVAEAAKVWDEDPRDDEATRKLRDCLDALSALPEAKPAAQAEDKAPAPYDDNEVA